MAIITVSIKLPLRVQSKVRSIYSFSATGTVNSYSLQARLNNSQVWTFRRANILSLSNACVSRSCTRLRFGGYSQFTAVETKWSSGTAKCKQAVGYCDRSNGLRTSRCERNRPRRCKHSLGSRSWNRWLYGFSRDFSTSAAALPFSIKKACLSSYDGKKFYFDTHAVVRLLEENSFTAKQSEIIVNALLKILNCNIEAVYQDMVTKVQQEIMLQQVMSLIASVKKDMVILEKSEFSALRTENEKLHIELRQLKKMLSDEMMKVRSDSKLDTNLEKSRVKEMYAEHEKKILEIRTEVLELLARQDREVTQTNRKIDTEVAGLKTMLESHKLDTIKYLAGSVFTCLTVVLGFFRLWV